MKHKRDTPGGNPQLTTDALWGQPPDNPTWGAPTGQPPCVLASFLATLKPGEHRLPAAIPKHTQLLLHLYGLPVSLEEQEHQGNGQTADPQQFACCSHRGDIENFVLLVDTSQATSELCGLMCFRR